MPSAKSSDARASTGKGVDGMWAEGTILISGKGYRYWVKHYVRRSQYGINGGKISKCMIKRGGEIVCNYDRGWDVEPVDDNTRVALEILLYDYN